MGLLAVALIAAWVAFVWAASWFHRLLLVAIDNSKRGPGWPRRFHLLGRR